MVLGEDYSAGDKLQFGFSSSDLSIPLRVPNVRGMSGDNCSPFPFGTILGSADPGEFEP